MEQTIMALLLIPMTVQDLKNKTLDLVWILAAGGVGMIWNIAWNNWGVRDIAASISLGMILIVIARLKRTIGTGDGVLFLSIGLICGWRECAMLLTGSLVCSLPMGIFLKLIRHKPGDYEIPFTPFIFIAWILQRW